MKTLHYGIAIGMMAALGACSNMGGGSSGVAHTAAATQPTVAPDMVRQVQTKLRDDGYYKDGSVDGIWGAGTQGAVRSFQHDHNLGSTGELDVPTLAALNVTGNPPASTNQSMSNTASTPSATDTTPTQPVHANPVPNTPPPSDTTTTSPTH